MTLEQALIYLYRHEINVSVASFWDGGFCVKLGDDMNGWLWEGNFLPNALHLAADTLLEAARKAYTTIEWEPLPQ